MSQHPTAARLARAAAVVALTLAYLDAVFHLRAGAYRQHGLSDWLDPYFINGLLEHWYQSARHLCDPASPLVYFPVRGTLGYSHGLILYAPFYIVARLFAAPFEAYTFALVGVIAAGTVSLYVCVRRVLGLGFIASVVVTASFCTAFNVISGATGLWSQRASVFLVPPIVLLSSLRPASRAARAALDAFVGCAAVLMYVQDFYTAQFCAWFVALCLAGVALSADTVRAGVWEAASTTARALREPVPARVAAEARPSVRWLVCAVIALGWAIIVLVHPFDRTEFGPIHVSARDPTRPFGIALFAAGWYVARRWSLIHRARAAGAAFAATGAVRGLRTLYRAHAPRIHAMAAGAALGVAVFLWIYWRAVQEHSAFAAEDVRRSLHAADLSSLGPVRWLLEAQPYGSSRTFVIAIVAAVLALGQAIVRRDRFVRRLAIWALVVIAVTFLLPLRVDGFSIWMLAVRPLPGMAVIRDPERAGQAFELFAAASMAAYLAWSRQRAIRWAMLALIIAAIAKAPFEPFEYGRETAVFERWVNAPIAIDPSCRSFFIKGASPAYMSRSGHMWSLYATDATFIAMRYRIPTLNGYSAWFPEGWGLANPQETAYMKAVDTWVRDHALTDVCALDIEARTMTPYQPR